MLHLRFPRSTVPWRIAASTVHIEVEAQGAVVEACLPCALPSTPATVGAG